MQRTIYTMIEYGRQIADQARKCPIEDIIEYMERVRIAETMIALAIDELCPWGSFANHLEAATIAVRQCWITDWSDDLAGYVCAAFVPGHTNISDLLRFQVTGALTEHELWTICDYSKQDRPAPIIKLDDRIAEWEGESRV